ncbi:MAG: hypothetical protein ACOYL6_08065 [Bacteriovoracaceae bacterium]
MGKLLIICLLIPALTEAKTLYIKSLKAPLLKEAKMGSTTITILERGAQVEEVKQSDKFVEVKNGSSTGFVNNLFLTSDAPSQKKESLLEKDVDISTKARKRASGFTSAAAARGLKEDSDDIFQYLGEADGARLKEMEALHIEASVGVAFLSERSPAQVLGTKSANTLVKEEVLKSKPVKEEILKEDQADLLKEKSKLAKKKNNVKNKSMRKMKKGKK